MAEIVFCCEVNLNLNFNCMYLHKFLRKNLILTLLDFKTEKNTRFFQTNHKLKQFNRELTKSKNKMVWPTEYDKTSEEVE